MQSFLPDVLNRPYFCHDDVWLTQSLLLSGWCQLSQNKINLHWSVLFFLHLLSVNLYSSSTFVKHVFLCPRTFVKLCGSLARINKKLNFSHVKLEQTRSSPASRCADNGVIVYWLTVRSTVLWRLPDDSLSSDNNGCKNWFFRGVSAESLHHNISLGFILSLNKIKSNKNSCLGCSSCHCTCFDITYKGDVIYRILWKHINLLQGRTGSGCCQTSILKHTWIPIILLNKCNLWTGRYGCQKYSF